MPFKCIRIGRMIWSVHSCQCANIKLLSNLSSFRFRLIVSTCRDRYIRLWLYVSFRVLLWCFRLQCFTLVCLLISRAPCANNPLSIRHCSVFTPCERIPLRTIYPTSPRGVDRSVLFVCLLIFRRLTNNGPIAVIGDTVLQTRFSPLLATYTTNQFSNIMPFGFPRDGDIIANVEIESRTGENVDWHGVGGASLSPQKHRPLAKAAIHLPLQYA